MLIYVVCDVTLSVYPHRAGLKYMPRPGAQMRGGVGGVTPPPIFKHSVLVVIIKSVPNQIQSSFMRGAKGAMGGSC